MSLDVVIFGGGAAGLWCLDRLRRAGFDAVLLEAHALGAGQTIQAQGIIHGGGKYALRGVADFAAVRATAAMPALWRRCIAGSEEPSLADAAVLAEQCLLWLPRGSLGARLQSLGFAAVVAQAGLLATPPVKLPRADWPAVLRESAVAVYSLAEEVVSTGSVLRALASRHRSRVLLYDPAGLRINPGLVRTSRLEFQTRVVVLTAGAGNAALLHYAGCPDETMQRRPLTMVLLRGDLPALFGHCVHGGKTDLTITTPTPGIWQVGGELAERLVTFNDPNMARRHAADAIGRRLPGLDLARLEIALYHAVRAEARTADQRRPSGVHAGYVAPGIIAGWPTKLCLTPALAEEILGLVVKELKFPAGQNSQTLPAWPAPPLARYPWEDAEWFPAA